MLRYFILSLLSIQIFAIHLGGVTSPDLNKLFKTYVAKTCSEGDCRLFKYKKYDSCKERVCNEDYVNFEEANILKCDDSKNTQGCLSENNFEASMCPDSVCVSILAKKIGKDLNEDKFYNLRSQQMRVVKGKSDREAKKSNIAIKNISKNLVGDNTQEETLVQTKKLYEASCQTKECLEKINSTFGHIVKEVKLTSEQIDKITNDKSFSTIPANIVNTYLNHGPWSPQMISLFKENIGSPNEEVKKIAIDCQRYIDENECNLAKQSATAIYKIQNYFSGNSQGAALAKKVYSSGQRNQYSVLCRLNLSEIPDGKQKLSDFFSKSHNTPYKGYIPAYRTAASKLDCLSKFTEIEKKYLDTLKSLGDYPALKEYSYIELGYAGQALPVREFIKGQCHAFIYIPTSDNEIPALDWFNDKSNKRVKWSQSYSGQNQEECRFKANRDLYKLNVDRFEEYIFFYGNIATFKYSSKALPHHRGLKPSWRFYSDRVTSSPKCKMTFKTHIDNVVTNYSDISLDGNCFTPCNETKKRLDAANKDQLKYKDLVCSIIPEIKSGAMYGFEAEIYNEAKAKSQKVCSYYNYHWSQKPIRTFMADSEKQCLGQASINSIKSAKEYIDYFGVETNQYYDLEIKFGDKQLLRYTGDVDCNVSSLRGEVNKYYGHETKKVKNKAQCIEFCEEYRNKIKSAIRVSPVFVKCSLGRAAYEPMKLNYTQADPYDPYVTIKEADTKSAEQYFDESFDEVWHGYPE